MLLIGAAAVVASALAAAFAARGAAPESCRPMPRGDAAWMRAHRSFLAGRGPGVRIIFIGDSLVAGWLTDGREAWERTFTPLGARAFGISGDRTQNVLWRIEHGELDGMPDLRTVVLCIGANNALLGHAPGEIARGVLACVGAVNAAVPGVRVIVVLPPPAGNNAAARRVREANDRIADACAAVRIPVSAMEPTLASGGAVDRSLAPDGLHPSAAGYQRWAEALLPAVRASLDGQTGSEKPAP
jgi:lysophospholipase L1-like esterase